MSRCFDRGGGHDQMIRSARAVCSLVSWMQQSRNAWPAIIPTWCVLWVSIASSIKPMSGRNGPRDESESFICTAAAASFFSRDQRHEYLKCTACGSRLAINFSDVSSAILAIAIAREGTQAVTDQIQFSYLDPGEIPAEW